jgi:hypothetical protein
MILLIRDPRDIAASWLDGASEGGWKRRTAKSPSRDVRKLARNYLNNLQMAKQAYDDHRGPKTLVLYEDLRVDTLGVMKRLYSDLAVEKQAWEAIPEDMKGEGKFFRKASPGGWCEDLTPEQAEIVERITAPVLAEFYA